MFHSTLIVMIAMTLWTVLNKHIHFNTPQSVHHVILTQAHDNIRNQILHSLTHNTPLFTSRRVNKIDYVELMQEWRHMPVEQRKSKIFEIELKNEYNAQYFGQVQLGSKGESFNMLFDTGSAYMYEYTYSRWVASTKCSGCKGAGIKDFYECSHSTVCTPTGDKVSLIYGSGNATGHKYYDDVGVDSLVAKHQQLLILDTLDSPMNFLGDGLVGLGFAKLSDGQPTLIDTLFKQQSINNNEFSIYLSDEHSFSGLKSTLVLGGVDPKFQNESKWSYCPVISDQYWAIKVDSISFVNKEGTIKKSLISHESTANEIKLNSILTVVDSGTSIITMDKIDYNNFMQFLINFNLYCYPSSFSDTLYQCDQLDMNKYPNIEIQMCGRSFIIPPQKYLLCQGVCVILIEMLDYPVIILGDEFIRLYYTHFIQSEPRQIGFVKAIQ